MSEVVSIGQIITDILVRPVEAVDFRIDTQEVETIQLNTGGDSFNVAVALSKLDVDVAFNGKIGADIFGELLIGRIKSCGIDSSGLVVAEGDSTSSSVALIRKNGERCFLFYPGANNHLGIEDIKWDAIDNAKIVHVGGLYTLPLLDGENVAKILRYAKEKGKLTTVDVSWDRSNRWFSGIRESLPYIDYFLPSYGEAKEIAQKDSPEEIARFLQSAGAKHVIIKLGNDGSYVKPADADGYVVAPVDFGEVVDTTGAGDSYVAGFIRGLLNGWDLAACALFATVVAGENIRKIGATAGIPAYHDALKRYKEESGKRKP